MPQLHEVKTGETLSQIGEQYGIDWREITGFKSGDPNIIFPGEQLNIPTMEGGEFGGFSEDDIIISSDALLGSAPGIPKPTREEELKDIFGQVKEIGQRITGTIQPGIDALKEAAAPAPEKPRVGEEPDITASIETIEPDEALPTPPTFKPLGDVWEKVKGFFADPEDTLVETYEERIAEAGIPEISTKIGGVDLRLGKLRTVFEERVAELEERPGGMGFFTRETARLQRQYDIQKNSLLLERESLAGNYDRAMDRALVLMDLEKSDRKEERDRNLFILNNLIDESRAERDFEMTMELELYRNQLETSKDLEEQEFTLRKDELEDVKGLAEQYPFAGIIIGLDDYATAISKVAPFSRKEFEKKIAPAAAKTEGPLAPTSFNIRAGLVGMTQSQATQILTQDTAPDWFITEAEEALQMSMGTEQSNEMWQRFVEPIRTQAVSAAETGGIQLNISGEDIAAALRGE